MIFTLNRKPMRLGTFVVGRPGILGLNDSLKRSKVYKVTFSPPSSSSFPLISKKPQQVLEKREVLRDALLAVYKGGTSSVTLMPISPHKDRDWLPPEPRNKII